MKKKRKKKSASTWTIVTARVSRQAVNDRLASRKKRRDLMPLKAMQELKERISPLSRVSGTVHRLKASSKSLKSVRCLSPALIRLTHKG